MKASGAQQNQPSNDITYVHEFRKNIPNSIVNATKAGLTIF